ncbi:hypothetical protein DSL92_07700 [Billgrantia gudaonensis]|uniref:Uncharacterized protein n=1 Tax=Billgrantia gudaonensis TaxID=376427 RepID=A0A3S0QFP0_9GAMM|nr:hypothetical protein DSL92_07700 [Halomonas gudaonensis]
MRGDYAHRLFDPSCPPWHPAAVSAAERKIPSADSCVIFVRRLRPIVDGRASAHLMSHFESQESTLLGRAARYLAASPRQYRAPRDRSRRLLGGDAAASQKPTATTLEAAAGIAPSVSAIDCRA